MVWHSVFCTVGKTDAFLTQDDIQPDPDILVHNLCAISVPGGGNTRVCLLKVFMPTPVRYLASTLSMLCAYGDYHHHLIVLAHFAHEAETNMDVNCMRLHENASCLLLPG